MLHYYNAIVFNFNILFFHVQGGKSSRIVNCVLALKSYSEWKQGGKNGSWKYGGNPKPPTNAKPAIMMKVSEPFMRSLSKGSRLGDKDGLLNDISTNSEGVSEHYHL